MLLGKEVKISSFSTKHLYLSQLAEKAKESELSFFDWCRSLNVKFKEKVEPTSEEVLLKCDEIGKSFQKSQILAQICNFRYCQRYSWKSFCQKNFHIPYEKMSFGHSKVFHSSYAEVNALGCSGK